MFNGVLDTVLYFLTACRTRCDYIDSVVTAIGRGRKCMLCCARFTAAQGLAW
jgi:hypothetical protein